MRIRENISGLPAQTPGQNLHLTQEAQVKTPQNSPHDWRSSQLVLCFAT